MACYSDSGRDAGADGGSFGHLASFGVLDGCQHPAAVGAVNQDRLGCGLASCQSLVRLSGRACFPRLTWPFAGRAGTADRAGDGWADL